MTVTGVGDDDANDETATIGHGVSGYGAVTAAAAVTVTVTDDVPNVSVCDDRTPAVRDAIVAAIEGITTCADVTVPQLNRIEALVLDFRSLDNLKENDFNNLSALQQLYLDNNSLSSLPEDIFAGLTNLQKLFLNNNALSSLPEDIFAGLANLQWLYLHVNGLGNLPEGIFTGLSSLRRLYLDTNSLSSLPDNVFNGLSSLETLFLANNNLVCLPKNLPWNRVASSGLRLDVTLPDCFGVSLNVTPTEVKEGNGGESLMVRAALHDGARATSVDTEVTISVSGGTAAEGVDFAAVSDFTITIPSGSEHQTGTFTLTATKDTEVEPGGETVWVSGTSILSSSTLPGTEVSSATVTILDDDPTVNVCDRSPAVQAAILRRTAQIHGITSCAEVTMTHLNEMTGSLDFFYQGVSSLQENDFAGLYKLQELYLSQNALSNLPEDIFNDLSDLEKLHLNTNGLLTSLPEGIFNGLSSLEELYLDSNGRLSILPEDIFNGLAKLQTLHLEEGVLSSLSEDIFNGLSNLQTLRLQINNLSSLPEGIFNGLTNLQRLYLYENPLGSLPEGIFNGLTNLQRLWLERNSLSSLPEGIFNGLANLNLLNLQRNALSSLPEAIFDDLSNLRTLRLEENSLSCLPRSLISRGLSLDVDLPDCFGVNLSVTPTEVKEGNGGESITVRATLSAGARATSVDTEVSISVAGGTASEGADFTAVDNDFTITIPSGSESATGSFTLATRADFEEDNDETVVVNGTSTVSFTLVTPEGEGDYSAPVGSATVTIRNVLPVPAPICDRTPAVQTAILEAIDGITNCADVSMVYLSRIEGLNLGSKGLNSLKGNDFAGLSNLRGLSLNNNSLSSLDADIFSGLSNLRNLFLFSNPLSSLPEDIFAGLSNLWGLYVLGIDLDCLPRSVPWDRVASGDLTLDVDLGLGVNLPDCFEVSLSVTPTAVHESNVGESIMVTATLSNGPRGRRVDTEVSISVSADTASEDVDFTAVNNNFTITIPTGSASATGTFTLTATLDNEREPGGETVRLSGRSTVGDYDAPVGSSTTVTINDALVGVWPIRLNTAEGGTAAYTVTLISQPERTVTITPISGDSGAVSLSPASLTFTTTNWETPRTVTVTGVQDDGGADETVTIRHSVSGAGSLTAAAAVAVSVTDDDDPAVSVCDRTPAVRDAILDAINETKEPDLTTCAEVSVSDLNGITDTLSLHNQGLSSLQKNDFANLSNLQDLLLHGNTLSSLDPGIFTGLSALRTLYLQVNHLSSLNADIFSGLTNLQTLYLSNNKLSSLNPVIFNGLSTLVNLGLNNNSLSSLPDNIFSGLTRLAGLGLANNGLTCLPRSVPWDRVADGVLTLDVDSYPGDPLPDCFGVSLRVIPTEVAESGRGQSVMVTAALNDGPRGRRVDTEVTVSVAEDTAGEHTATEGRYFTAVEDFTITIPNGSESATGTFTLTARRDTVVEAGGEMGGETVLVSGTSTVADYAAEVGSTTVTITDGPRFSLSLTANASEVNEGESVYFTITRAWIDPTFTDPLPAAIIPVNIGYHGKILEPGADVAPNHRRFLLGDSQVAIELFTAHYRLILGENQESVEVLAAVTHDNELNDGDGMVNARLDLEASASPYDVLQDQAWTRVVDDDIPEVALILLKDRIIEGDLEDIWEVRRSCCSETGLRPSWGTESRKFQNNDYYPDKYYPYKAYFINGGRPNDAEDAEFDTESGPSYLFLYSGQAMRSFPYTGRSGRANDVGPLGGYFRYVLVPYSDVSDSREINSQEIPVYSHTTFNRRYTISDADYDKTLWIDNNAPGVSIETSQTSIPEGDEVEFTVKRFGGAQGLFSLIGQNIRINVEQTGDYLPAAELGTRVVRMEIGQTEYNLRIPTNDDPFDYPDGSVTVTILEGAPTDLSEDTYEFDTRYSETAGRYLHKASVDISDNDSDEVMDIFLSPTELQIPEGGSGTYTVMLTSPPEYGETNVKPLKLTDGDPDVAVASSTLTFSADDWNTPQTVTITAEDDDDMDDDSAEIVHTVEFLPTSESPFRANIVVFDPSVQVSVLDNDLSRVSLSI